MFSLLQLLTIFYFRGVVSLSVELAFLISFENFTSQINYMSNWLQVPVDVLLFSLLLFFTYFEHDYFIYMFTRILI